MDATAGLPLARPRSDGTLPFFLLLIATTALPYLLFPLSAHLFPESRGLSHGASALLLIGAQGHVAASFLFYADPEARRFMLGERRTRFLEVPLLLVVATGFAVYAVKDALSYVVVGFWIWQTHHYTRQNHGILAFVSRAEGAPILLAERVAITLTGLTGIAGMITFVTPYHATELASFGWQLHAVAIGTYACAWLAYGIALRKPAARSSPLRLAVTLILMLFYLPLFFFEDALSAVWSYAVAHGLQYLVFMGFVANTPPARRARAFGGLVLLTLVGGLLLKSTESSADLLGGDLGSAVLGVGLGIVMWHFVLDAGIWRLSEPFQRAYMAERFPFLKRRPQSR